MVSPVNTSLENCAAEENGVQRCFNFADLADLVLTFDSLLIKSPRRVCFSFAKGYFKLPTSNFLSLLYSSRVSQKELFLVALRMGGCVCVF